LSNPVAHYSRSIVAFSRDARLFLLITILFGSAMSLYWTDFNLYVESTGQGGSTLGWLLAVSQLAGVAVAFPASAISDRIGRRSVMVLGAALVTLALFAFLPGNRSSPSTRCPSSAMSTSRSGRRSSSRPASWPRSSAGRPRKRWRRTWA
jgi:MFS family permease